ncbi:hypothetical protein ACRAWG_34990 [Methylobacterium sp. P31]
MSSFWDSQRHGPGAKSSETEETPLQRARRVLDSRPAGGQYHNPPLYLMQEVEQMPPDVQAWIKSLGEGERWIAEHQLNLVGVRNFAEHWEYQRDYVEYMLNF